MALSCPITLFSRTSFNPSTFSLSPLSILLIGIFVFFDIIFATISLVTTSDNIVFLEVLCSRLLSFNSKSGIDLYLISDALL